MDPGITAKGGYQLRAVTSRLRSLLTKMRIRSASPTSCFSHGDARMLQDGIWTAILTPNTIEGAADDEEVGEGSDQAGANLPVCTSQLYRISLYQTGSQDLPASIAEGVKWGSLP